jgi:pimeloyl-ACP methyl ester carboxylesterase
MKKPCKAAFLAAALSLCSCSSLGMSLFLALDPPDKGLSLTRVETGPGEFACGYWFQRSKGHERLLVYLPGSGSGSALGRKAGGMWKVLSDGWMFKQKFDKGFDLFIADKANILPGMDGSKDEAFLRAYTLDGRVAAAVATIQAFVAAHTYREVYLLGASEGATIAARVFLALRGTVDFKKVAVISGNSLSQAEEFGILADKDGLKMPDSYRAGLTSLPEEYPKIQDDPDSITKMWFGHTYRRWSTFLPYRPLEDLLKIDVPLYAYHGRKDISTPVEGSRALKAAFDAAGKSNLLYVEDDGDHSGFMARMNDIAIWFRD